MGLDAKVDDSHVLARESSDIETTDESKSATIVDIASHFIQFCSKFFKGKSLLGNKVAINSKRCMLLADVQATRAEMQTYT